MLERTRTEMSEKSWYVIYSKANQEKLADEQLARQGYTTYLPLVRVDKFKNNRQHSSVIPLFPRYLFIYLDTTTDNWVPIRSTIGVSNMVKFGSKHAEVTDKLVEKIKKQETSEGIHEIKYQFQQGDRVRMVDGPLSDLEGIFMANRSEDRVFLLMQMLGKQMRVTTNINTIEHIC